MTARRSGPATDSGAERVLVIRVWDEPGRTPSFRARVIALGPSGGPIEQVGVTTSASDVEGWVRSWLAREVPR